MNIFKLVQKRLAAKATLFFSLAVILSAVFVVTISTLSDRAREMDHILHLAQLTAFSSADTVVQPIKNRSIAALEAIYKQLHSKPGVSGAFVVGKKGNVLSTTKPEYLSDQFNKDMVLVKKALRQGTTQRQKEKGRFQLALPIYADKTLQSSTEIIGALSISLIPEQAMTGLWASLKSNLWKGLALLCVGLPMSMLIFGRLFTPVKELIRAANCAAAGDLNVRAQVTSKDEFGILADSINLMLERMKANMDRTRWLAYGDNLTRLANKTAFSERLKQLVDSGKSSGALFLIDLDGFKRLNDAYGEEEGDLILKATADRLRKIAARFVRRVNPKGTLPPPMLARLSGDEFALLAPGCVSAPLAQEIAQEILNVLAQPLLAAGQPVTLSARIGIAMYPHDASDSKSLLNSANFAIDVAKKEGGDTWQFFEPSMTQAAIRRITLQNEMRRALKNREFIVFYQPKINVRDGSISGCEALVRWQKSPGKIISPGAFIDVAEETGLINEIGDYVLAEACAAAARWRAAGNPCSVAVNVSAVQFSRDNFAQIVGKILEDTGLPHDLLELELTESVAMTNPERLMEQVAPLRDRGVRFAIDDFGTGHSSLAYLTRLPFDVFKIDQSFVREMTEDKHARVIVQTVLAMAESLGYHTVAEGVETREHFAFLQLHCCDYVQGYYFSRPLPENEFVVLLTKDRQGQENRISQLAQSA